MNVHVPPCGCQPGDPRPSPESCYCSVEDLLRILRRRYSLAVMGAVHRLGPARHNAIADTVPRASSSTLADTLRALETARLLERRGEAPPLYALTASGEKLLARLRPLLEEVQEG